MNWCRSAVGADEEPIAAHRNKGKQDHSAHDDCDELAARPGIS